MRLRVVKLGLRLSREASPGTIKEDGPKLSARFTPVAPTGPTDRSRTGVPEFSILRLPSAVTLILGGILFDGGKTSS